VRPHFGYLTEFVDSEAVLWPLAAALICWIPRMQMCGRALEKLRKPLSGTKWLAAVGGT